MGKCAHKTSNFKGKKLHRNIDREPFLPYCFHSEDAVPIEVEEGIYKYEASDDNGNYRQVCVCIENLIFDEGITPDDVAYIQACYWDAGGCCLPEDNYAVYVAIGKEHFPRLLELGGPDFMYHKKSKMGSEEARIERLKAFFEIEDKLV